MIFYGNNDQFTCDSLLTFALSFPASRFDSLSCGSCSYCMTYGCLLYSYILVSTLSFLICPILVDRRTLGALLIFSDDHYCEVP
jgi:hypothetical protein